MNKEISNIKGALWDRIAVTIIVMFFGGFAILAWFKPVSDMSVEERRKLKDKPSFSVEKIVSGQYMKEFEEYALDQIPLRQNFREIKALYGTYVLGQLDNNELTIFEGHIINMEHTLDENSLEYAANRFNTIYDKYLSDKNINVYMSIIPDKNYFNGRDYTLKYDYEYLVEKMCNDVENQTYIDIFSLLDLEDYYRTDPHLRQENIVDVAAKLAESMGTSISTDYEQVQVTKEFYGTYYGQMALPVKGEEMSYLTNDIVSNCTVYDYENNRDIDMYNLDAVSGNDPYEMYLYGPLSLITITNPKADNEKELIIFRDSFASSVAPMLATAYNKVTLVDIRYVSPEYLGNFIEFNEQDVLFLYSTSVLNNSDTIK